VISFASGGQGEGHGNRAICAIRAHGHAVESGRRFDVDGSSTRLARDISNGLTPSEGLDG
jgi:hypothetical protein